jgi:hypothetical protein
VSKYLFAVFLALFGFISCCPTLRPSPVQPSTHNPTLHPPQDVIFKTAYIDYRFTDAEQDLIAQAIKSWECSANFKLQFKIIFNATDFDYDTSLSKDHLFIWRAGEQNPKIIEFDRELIKNNPDIKRITIGLYNEGTNYNSPKILLVIDRMRDNLKTVAKHELFHALISLEHPKDRNSVGFAWLDMGSKDITSVDIGLLCGKYHWNVSEFRACNL